jgi:hypothetical protein
MADAARARAHASSKPARAHLVHQTRRRMRFKIPTKRHDQAFFAQLEQRLAELPKIEAALVTPETASVLLSFAEGNGATIAAALDALEIVSVAGKDTGAGAEDAEHAEDRDRLSRALASGRVDRRALAFTVLVLLLLRQLLKGGWLAPGLALIWFLLEVLRARQPQEPAEVAGTR